MLDKELMMAKLTAIGFAHELVNEDELDTIADVITKLTNGSMARRRLVGISLVYDARVSLGREKFLELMHKQNELIEKLLEVE